MKPIRFAIALSLLSGCGSPVLGNWTTTSTVVVSDPSGTTTPTQVTTDFVLLDTSTGPVWRAGGGCDAPLLISGVAANLETPG